MESLLNHSENSAFHLIVWSFKVSNASLCEFHYIYFRKHVATFTKTLFRRVIMNNFIVIFIESNILILPYPSMKF